MVRVKRRIRLEDLGPELRMLPQRIGEAAQTTLQIPFMVAAAKSFCPVDTGALMDSIRAESRGPYEAALVAGGGGFINPRTGREVDYAIPVHEGTSRMPARPFFLQAVIQERERFAREMFQKTAEAL